jgi:phosphoglucosamine mutase
VFHELGAEVVAIANQPNGININHECGATHTDTLKKAVLEQGADLGIALDGDGDRLMMVDAEGAVYDGDQTLYAIVKHRHSMGGFQGGVVGTAMTNLAVEQAFSSHSIPFHRAKVGDRYVMEDLAARGWLWGGENSGHILCLDRHTTGDGIVSALQVLDALRSHQTTLADYTAEVKLFPQVMINVKVAPGFNLNQADALWAEVKAAEAALANRGRVLLRASGTEPLIRVMVEGENREEVTRWAQQLAQKVVV